MRKKKNIEKKVEEINHAFDIVYVWLRILKNPFAFILAIFTKRVIYYYSGIGIDAETKERRWLRGTVEAPEDTFPFTVIERRLCEVFKLDNFTITHFQVISNRMRKSMEDPESNYKINAKQ